MARIRTVKPEMLDDEKVAALPHLAWRLFVSLIMTADDYGNQHGAPAKIRGTALWATEATDGEVREALARLSRDSLVALYSVRGQAYVSIVGWSKHQRVDKPGRPIVPGPEQADSRTSEDSRDSRETPANPRETLATDHDQDRDHDLEGKGRISHTAGAREGQGDPGPVTDATAGSDQDVPGKTDERGRPVDRVLVLAERFRSEVDTARRALLVELGAPFPPSRTTDAAVLSMAMAVVAGWCASEPDQDPEAIVAARSAHLLANRLAVARDRKRADWWAPSTFWDPDGIGKDLEHRTPADAVAASRARAGQRDGQPRRPPQPDPPRTPVNRL